MAAGTSVFSRYLSALKHVEHQVLGPKVNILASRHKILAFKNKFQVWKKHFSSGNIETFPRLLQIQDQSEYKGFIPFHSIRKEYPMISAKAVKILLQFAISDL
jgi:hypothetical protein